MTENGMAAFRAAVAASRNSLIPYYLMASFAYYHRDAPFLDDATYDQLCKDLDAEWGGLEHMHKGVIDREHLRAGTCLLPRSAFPTICKSAAGRLAGIPWDPVDNPAGHNTMEGVVINVLPAPPQNPDHALLSGGPPPGSAPPPGMAPARVRVRTRTPA